MVAILFLQTTGNLTEMDGIIKYLMDGVSERDLHQCLNIIIVADHGK